MILFARPERRRGRAFLYLKKAPASFQGQVSWCLSLSEALVASGTGRGGQDLKHKADHVHEQGDREHGAATLTLALGHVHDAEDTTDSRAENTKDPVDGLHLIGRARASTGTAVLLPKPAVEELAAVLTLLRDSLNILAAVRALFLAIISTDGTAYSVSVVFGLRSEFIGIRYFDDLLTVWTFSTLPCIGRWNSANRLAVWT